MTRVSPVDSRPDEALSTTFRNAEKVAARFRIGVEAESFGVQTEGLRPVRYAGEHGLEALLRTLADRHGGALVREVASGPAVAARLGSSGDITLEPGGQIELSGAPVDDLHTISAQLRAHFARLNEVTAPRGVRWLGIGFHPFAARGDLEYVPKMRYALMREYFPTSGRSGLDMMLRTATVQANFDYADEADALQKLRLALRLAPLTSALHANSPVVEGQVREDLSARARIWLDVDPGRCGLVAPVWKEGSGYEDYVRWALNAPMMFLMRGEHPVAVRGLTFGAFWRNGFAGERATQDHWNRHLNTLFPDVRLKQTLEIRSADSQGLAGMAGLPALWTGLFYDDSALARATALTSDWTVDEVRALSESVCRDGLRAQFRGAPLLAVAEKIVDLASAGLAARRRLDDRGRDERIYLAPLVASVEHAQTPAERLVAWVQRRGSVSALVLDDDSPVLL